jgi:hypothetical protein
MILAGAAAEHHSPALAIAVCGAVGAVVALAVAVSATRGASSRGPDGRHQRA